MKRATPKAFIVDWIPPVLAKCQVCGDCCTASTKATVARQRAEIRELRAVEKLAREFVDLAGSNEGTPGPCEAALRAALSPKRKAKR